MTSDANPRGTAAPCLLLLVPARTYRAADFLLAASRMGLDLVVGSDGALPLGGRPVIPVSLADPAASAARLIARAGPVAAVVAADTPMLVLAAEVAARMGLPHNPVPAVLAAADKVSQRRRWAESAVAQPAFAVVPAPARDDDVRSAAETVGFPCVVKAISLSASQGVLRADDPAAAVRAARRIRPILAAAGRPAGEPLLIEEYLPGPELSIDGLLADGGLTVTAIFDKPGAPDGPTFEETLLITPPRLAGPVLAAAVRTAGRAARALGLTHGPVHAELRVSGRGDRPCSNWRRAVSAACAGARCVSPAVPAWKSWCWPMPWAGPAPAGYQPGRPSGVFMLPVPRPGVLRAVEGRAEAAAVPGITGLTITIPIGQHVRPLPEGDRYLGFIFAEGDTRRDVGQALAAARARLHVVIG